MSLIMKIDESPNSGNIGLFGADRVMLQSDFFPYKIKQLNGLFIRDFFLIFSSVMVYKVIFSKKIMIYTNYLQ